MAEATTKTTEVKTYNVYEYLGSFYSGLALQQGMIGNVMGSYFFKGLAEICSNLAKNIKFELPSFE